MSKTVFVLILVQLLDAIGLGLLLPILPYYVQEFGAGPIEVTQLIAIYALGGLIFSPLAGFLSDRFGRKPIVIVTTIGAALAYGGLIAAESLLAIFVARAIGGTMTSKAGVVNAWLIDAVSEEDRTRYLGLLGSMNGIGMLAGPILASIVLALSDGYYQAIFMFAAVLTGLAAILLFTVKDLHAPEKAEGEPSSNQHYRIATHFDIYLVNFFLFLGFSVIFSTSAIYMQYTFNWEATTSGLAIGAMTGCIAAARVWVAPPWLSKFGSLRGTTIAGCIFGIGLVFATLSPQPLIFMPFYCIAAIAYAVAALGVTIVLAGEAPQEVRGTVMGFLTSTISAALVLGSATHGYFFETLAPSVPFRIYGTLAFLTFVVWAFFRHRKQASEESA